MFYIIISVALLVLRYKNKDLFQDFKNASFLAIVVFLVSSIVFFPKDSFEAAQSGVSIWFNIVFPSLLPFFIGADLLIQLGIVSFIGILLEPLIRPIFKVPGEGSFVFAMSLTSGYPVGVKLATKLRSENIFTRAEAQRVLAFCSTSGPLFMLGAVSIGMFENLELGIVIVTAHYLGAILTGLLFRFYGPHEIKNNYFKRDTNPHHISKEFAKLLKNKRKPFGVLLGNSVKDSVETLLSIGGFIILFSVIIKLLTLLGIIQLISNATEGLWSFFHIGKLLQTSIISGVFEITIGCKLLSEVQNISFFQQAVISTLLISWSGFSIHAQAASMINKTDLSTGIYMFSKALHSFFSFLLVYPIIGIRSLILNNLNKPVFFQSSQAAIMPSWTERIVFSSEMFCIITITVITIAFTFQLLSKIHIFLSYAIKK